MTSKSPSPKRSQKKQLRWREHNSQELVVNVADQTFILRQGMVRQRLVDQLYAVYHNGWIGQPITPDSLPSNAMLHMPTLVCNAEVLAMMDPPIPALPAQRATPPLIYSLLEQQGQVIPATPEPEEPTYPLPMVVFIEELGYCWHIADSMPLLMGELFLLLAARQWSVLAELPEAFEHYNAVHLRLRYALSRGPPFESEPWIHWQQSRFTVDRALVLSLRL